MEPVRAFLLRCWNETSSAPGEGPEWRFSIREIGGEQRLRGFATLEMLIAFLRVELTRRTDQDPSEWPDPSSQV